MVPLRSFSPNPRFPYHEIDIDILAGRQLTDAVFAEEQKFRRLSTEEKVNVVMNHQPRIFQLETTTRCNLNCPLCSTHHLGRGALDTPVEIFETIADANPRMHYACLHVMGEPLLSRNLFSVIRLLKSRSVFTYFASNGMLLGAHVDNILSSGLDKISISLDGITQEDLVRYRRGANLDQIVTGIRALLRARESRGAKRPRVQVQTIMFAYNEPKEAEIVRFLTDLGVDRIKLKKPSFDSFGGRNDDAGAFERAPNDAARKYTRNAPDYFPYRDRAVCRMLFQGSALADGSVVPCCIDFDGTHPFGNLQAQGWKDIWNSDQRRAVLRRFFEGRLDICRTCTFGYDYSTTVYDRSPGTFVTN